MYLLVKDDFTRCTAKCQNDPHKEKQHYLENIAQRKIALPGKHRTKKNSITWKTSHKEK